MRPQSVFDTRSIRIFSSLFAMDYMVELSDMNNNEVEV